MYAGNIGLKCAPMMSDIISNNVHEPWDSFFGRDHFSLIGQKLEYETAAR